MLDSSIVSVQMALAHYGVIALFLLGFLEEIFFFIPSSFLFIALGFLMIDAQAAWGVVISTAFLNIALLTSLGVTAGAACMYGLVYWGGKPFIERYGKYIRVSWHDLERFDRWFERGYRDELILLFFRAVPLFPITIVSIFCGLIRISLREFLWTTYVGTLVRVFFLAFLGWYAGREYEQYAVAISGAEQYAVIVMFVLVVGYIAWYFSKHKN